MSNIKGGVMSGSWILCHLKLCNRIFEPVMGCYLLKVAPQVGPLRKELLKLLLSSIATETATQIMNGQVGQTHSCFPRVIKVETFEFGVAPVPIGEG